MEIKNLNTINDTATTNDDTTAVEALYGFMIEADSKAKKALLQEGHKVCDADTLVDTGIAECVQLVEDFCQDFTRFWAGAESYLRQAIRCGEGVSELIYDHAIGEFYYGQTLVGKTEVRLDEALVRRYLLANGWREDASQNALFSYDLRKQFLQILSK